MDLIREADDIINKSLIYTFIRDDVEYEANKKVLDEVMNCKLKLEGKSGEIYKKKIVELEAFQHRLEAIINEYKIGGNDE